MDGSPPSLRDLAEIALDTPGGDRRGLSAFSRIYRENFGFVWSLVRRAGVPSEQIEDAVQEVFLTAHRRLHTFVVGSSMRAWLYGISRRVCWRHRRTSQRRQRKLAAFACEVERRSTGGEERFDANVVLEYVLSGLDEPRRTVFVLSELHGMTRVEIAEAIDVPAGTVASRLRAARRDVASLVSRAGLDERDALHAVARVRQQSTPSEHVLSRGWLLLVPQLLQSSLATKAAVSMGTTSTMAAGAVVAAAVTWGSLLPAPADDPRGVSSSEAHETVVAQQRIQFRSSFAPRRSDVDAPPMADRRGDAFAPALQERGAAAPHSTVSASPVALPPTEPDWAGTTTMALLGSAWLDPGSTSSGVSLAIAGSGAAGSLDRGSKALSGGVGAVAVPAVSTSSTKSATPFPDAPSTDYASNNLAVVHNSCSSGDAYPVAAVQGETTVHFVFGDASTHAVAFPIGGVVPWQVAAVAITRDHTAVAWTRPDRPPSGYTSTVVIYDDELRARTKLSNLRGRVTDVAVLDGRVVFSRTHEPGQNELSVVETDGSWHDLPGVAAVGTGHGEWIPVMMDSSGYGWFSPDDQHALAHTVSTAPLWVRSFTDTIVAAMPDESGHGRLLLARPEHSQSLALELDADELAHAAIASHPEGWLVFASPTRHDRLWRLDLAADVVEPIDVTLPGGVYESVVDADCAPPAVDEHGVPMLAARGRGGLVLVRPNADSWQTLGDAFVGVSSLSVQASGGALVIEGEEPSRRCPLPRASAWRTDEQVDALQGHAVQVVAQNGRSRVIPAAPRSTSLRADGGCFAYEHLGDGSLEFADVNTGLVLSSGLRGRVVWRQ